MKYMKHYNQSPRTVKWKDDDPTRRLVPKSFVTDHWMIDAADLSSAVLATFSKPSDDFSVSLGHASAPPNAMLKLYLNAKSLQMVGMGTLVLAGEIYDDYRCCLPQIDRVDRKGDSLSEEKPTKPGSGLIEPPEQ